MLEFVLFLLVGIAIGFVIGMFFQKSKGGQTEVAQDPRLGTLENEINQLRESRSVLEKENGQLSGRLEKSIEVFNDQKQSLEQRNAEVTELSNLVSTLKSNNAHLEEKLVDQKKEIEELNKRFKIEFENLANEILKRNTKEFNENNQKQISDILNPLKEKIEGFEKKVNEAYKTESDSRNQLMGQVKQLMTLNQKISEEASNLTKALKGDTQKQGAWGEFILEKILENSGLEKGVEYETQVSNRTDDGVFRPDVVVTLPDDKYIIIDSKVSLVAYESYVNANDADEAQAYLKQHITSLRQHVKNLSGKNYASKTRGQSLDFVLMFVPIEAGFSEALKNDAELYNFAWDNRIVIVSPTTLLATLRTIASVWKQEKQNKNVMAIAEESGKLYDKFVLFLNDFEKIKRGIDQSAAAYDGALNKLQTGNGNLIRRAEKIKELGAKTSKSIDATLIDQSSDE